MDDEKLTWKESDAAAAAYAIHLLGTNVNYLKLPNHMENSFGNSPKSLVSMLNKWLIET